MAKDKHSDPVDLDQDGEMSHAADEPTAVWDAEMLRKAGLGEVLAEAPELGPATPAHGIETPSIIVAQDAAEARPPAPLRPSRAQPAARGMGWAPLIAVACLLGALAYAAMRLLR